MIENELIKYISQFIVLDEEEIKALHREIPIKTFKKGTVLLKEGQVSTACYFNLRGLVRQYHLVDGEEKTTFFIQKNKALPIRMEQQIAFPVNVIGFVKKIQP